MSLSPKKITGVLVVAVIAMVFGFGYAKREGVVKSILTPTRNPEIIIKPDIILPGDPVLITVDATSTPVSVTWNGKLLATFSYDGMMRAFVPVDFNEKRMQHDVVAVLANGQSLTKSVTISPREKIELPLGIPQKLGGNTPQAAITLVNNLVKENRVLNSVTTATTTLWSKPFRYPTENVLVTDEYGYDRKTVQQTIVHKGTDFRATIGTEVRAMNKGIVRIARPFTVYGNTVVIDHGLGVQTLYMHLSEIQVKEGQMIEKGRVIGKSGDTGYVDAPHLHISIKIQGVSIDPMTFLQLF